MSTETPGHLPYQCRPETCGGTECDPCHDAILAENRRIEDVTNPR